jgi:hypothetical protein
MQQHPLAIATPMISNAPLQIDLMSPSQLPPMMDLMVRDAKFCLERLAKHYKFTVSYSDFPKAADEYFSLVTLGLDKPILCHGCGESKYFLVVSNIREINKCNDEKKESKETLV